MMKNLGVLAHQAQATELDVAGFEDVEKLKQHKSVQLLSLSHQLNHSLLPTSSHLTPNLVTTW